VDWLRIFRKKRPEPKNKLRRIPLNKGTKGYFGGEVPPKPPKMPVQK
jgi:hypothetical protein